MVFGTQEEYKKKDKKNEVILYNTFFYFHNAHKDKIELLQRMKTFKTMMK